MSRLLIIAGIGLVVLGLAARALPLFRLPGDLRYQGEHFSLYFPFTTCLIISAVLSLLFYLFRKWPW